jgi:tetratricopeptide (TPR) repeat protein
MPVFNRLVSILLAFALLAPVNPVQAKTKKGDRFLAEGRGYEAKKEWDQALMAYEKAMAEDPSDIGYQMAMQKARFQAGQVHVEAGMKLRTLGQLGEALLEFQKAIMALPGVGSGRSGNLTDPRYDRAGAQAGAGDRPRSSRHRAGADSRRGSA